MTVPINNVNLEIKIWVWRLWLLQVKNRNGGGGRTTGDDTKNQTAGLKHETTEK